jgi:3',5'-cyclic-AMP phosphodiesterase
MKKRYFFIFFLVVVLVFVFLLLLGKPLPLLIGKLTNFSWPKEEKTESFVFAVAGDNHSNTEVYNKLIQKIDESNAVFFVDLGDKTCIGAASEYAESKALLNNLKVPYHMVIGDHDIVGDGYNLWQQYFGPTYYSWNYGNVHFVALNDVLNENGFSEEQLSWLEQDLSSTKKELKFVFLHRPPRCPFTVPEELGFTGPKSEERIDQFLSILREHKVNKIYAGHIHNLLNYTIDSIPITVTGGAGGPIHNIPLIGKDTHHYLEVEVSGGNFEQRVVEL